MAKVSVGMSGGIDSSAAAYLLQKEGHHVTGITFTAFREEGYKKCCSIEEITAAKAVCAHLGIPHKTVDVQDIFEAKIIRYFIESYQAGLTPNPCVLCNRFIKFGALLEYALAEGAELFATGHYVRLDRKDNRLLIRKGIDENKDQSYFLSYIEKEKLAYILLPLGGLRKEEVRQIVAESGMPIQSGKAESQDVCFIKDDYREFLLARGVKESAGSFYYQGTPIGKHRGIPFYSLGQRRGLSVALGERIFVREMNPEKNQIGLGEKPMAKEFTIDKINSFTEDFKDGEYLIQTRYRSSLNRGQVRLKGGLAYVTLEDPQEIITPGQFAVIYQRELVYASGVIKDVALLP
jgi:tRNA-uridine 2-sulfurtransferase